MERELNTEYILSLSYGKDSIACLFALEKLGWPLDRIIHAEVWATDDIPADLPPMVEFKKKADQIILDRFGIAVEHVCETGRSRERETYEHCFYSERKRRPGVIRGFPLIFGAWCNSKLKIRAIKSILQANLRKDVLSSATKQEQAPARNNQGVSGSTGSEMVRTAQSTVFSPSTIAQGANTNIVQYLGIAADEPERIERHTKSGIALPLVEAGWDEAYCRKLCEDNGLLSPIYTSAARGGCWFCHNQGVEQMRLLRQNYPDLWRILLKWDSDSPVPFKPDGHTVHDYDRRFAAEEAGLVPIDRKFRWKMLEETNESQTS